MAKYSVLKDLLNKRVALTTKGDALTDEVGTISEVRDNFVLFLVNGEPYGERDTLKLWVSVDEIAVITELNDTADKNPRLAQIKRIK